MKENCCPDLLIKALKSGKQVRNWGVIWTKVEWIKENRWENDESYKDVDMVGN